MFVVVVLQAAHVKRLKRQALGGVKDKTLASHATARILSQIISKRVLCVQARSAFV